MSDRIPGSSYSNPVHYRGWRIYIGEWTPFEYVHEDYDGPEDNRCGTAKTVEEAKREIDEYIVDKCEHDYENVGHLGLCISYRCAKCGDEYEKDVS